MNHPTDRIAQLWITGIITSSMGPPRGIDPTTHHTMNGCSITELHLAPETTKYKKEELQKNKRGCGHMQHSILFRKPYPITHILLILWNKKVS